MLVREIMTENPAHCTPGTNLQQVAQMMVDCDCGAIPVIESDESEKPAGIVTDRDIVTRLIARGQNPLQSQARDAMTTTTVSVVSEADLKEAARLMEEKQIRRLLVVDDGRCVGILAQADLARHAPEEQTGEVVEEISAASEKASEPSRA